MCLESLVFGTIIELQSMFTQIWLNQNFPKFLSNQIKQVLQSSHSPNIWQIAFFEVHICVGKEWYRFPSNFFLPTEHVELNFIKSGFTGQLPKPYSPETQTWGIPSDMNEKNIEEPSRYVRIEQEDFFFLKKIFW